MKIGIDARIFKFHDYKGIATSSYMIIKELCNNNCNHEYYLISNTNINIPDQLPNNWNMVVSGNFQNGILWNEFELPIIIRDLGLDAFWGVNFLLPPRVSGCRYYVTVHDLALFRFKNTASKGTYVILRLMGKKSCLRADKIFTISKSTAQDVTKLYGIDDHKIVLTYNGVDSAGLQSMTSKQPNLLKQTDSFFVFLSTIEPRKNPVTLLRAYELYRNKDYGNEKLVFVGAKGWKLKEFDTALNASKYNKDIVFVGYVSNEEKKWILERAKALVYPSLYEGFGLPILEAFSLKTPVITCNVSAMPEVGKDAAFYINDPLDYEGLAELMHKTTLLAPDETEIIHEKMSKVVSGFSWKVCSDIIIHEIEREIE